MLDTAPDSDIFLLTETWVEPEGSAPDLDGYVCISLARPYKSFGAGSSSGGLACYVKTALSPHVKQWKASSDASLLWLKVDKTAGFKRDLFVGLTYAWPEGSTHYDLPIAVDVFDTLAEDISSIYAAEGLVLLAGDFNARTATVTDHVAKEEYESLLDDNVPLPAELPEVIAQRNSCDTTVNRFGRRLIELCQTANLLILNGRVRGDTQGAFTFQSANGRSVVDYFVADPNMFQYEMSLCVQDIVPESDHCPLTLKISDRSANQNTLPSSAPAPTMVQGQEQGSGLMHEHAHLPQLPKICYKPAKEEIFCSTLAESLSFHFDCDSIDDQTCYATALQECITSSAVHAYGHKPTKCNKHRHQPWFDDECKLARKQYFALAYTDPARSHLRTAYKRLTKRKRSQFEHAQMIETCNLATTNAYEFWRRFRVRKSTQANIGAQDWHEAFASLVGEGSCADTTPDDLSVLSPPLSADTYDDEDAYDLQLNADISSEEILLAFKRLKRHKAAGIDGIKPEFLLDAEDILVHPLTVTFNQMLHKGVPEHWCMGVIHPIFKSGDPNDPSNYRGITVTIILAKLFAMILEKRISDWAEGKGLRAAGQAGFRRDHRTTDNLFIMNALIDQTLKEGQKLYCCFVDFKKAFDSIPRASLWEALEGRGLSSLTLSAIKSAYAKDKACVLTQAGLTDSFPCMRGVKQGCPASPLLFGLYIDELERILIASEDTIDAPSLYAKLLPILLFADDIALFSYSPEGLQAQIDILADFCKLRGLEVNVKKTKVVVFEPVKTCSPCFLYCRQPVEQVEYFKYLGITFHGNRGMSCAAEQLAIAAQKATFALLGQCQRHHIQEPRLKLQLFDALVRPVLSYACEVWAPIAGAKALQQLEQVHKQFLRRLLGVPNSTCLKMLYAEFGRLPLEQFWWQQCMKYIERLHSMEDSRLCKLAFMAECRNNLGWWKKIGMRCTKLGMLPPTPESDYDFTSAVHTAHQMAIEDMMTAKPESRKQQTYFSFKLDFQMENYISEAKNKHLRRLIANFRIGNHWLKVQSGRYDGVEYDQRICESCGHGIDDEMHAIFECSAHDNLRSKYADLFMDLENRDLKSFLAQNAVHRIALFFTDCKALKCTQKAEARRQR